MVSKNSIPMKFLCLFICLTWYWLYPCNLKNVSTKEEQSHKMISVDVSRLSFRYNFSSNRIQSCATKMMKGSVDSLSLL